MTRSPVSATTFGTSERVAIEEANLRFLSEVRKVAETTPESRFRSRPKHIFARRKLQPPHPTHAETKQGINVRSALNGALREMLAQEPGCDCARRRFARSLWRSVQSDHRPFHGISLAA